MSLDRVRETFERLRDEDPWHVEKCLSDLAAHEKEDEERTVKQAKMILRLQDQRADLLAALREIVGDLEARHFDCLDACPEAKVYAVAQAALAEIEEEK